jgi:3,4-dihydroxy-2-butanone 4-phosphate synthase
MDTTVTDKKANITRAIEALHQGKVILLLDDNDRENEGDLIVAAEKINKQSMNFLIKKGSGVVCLAMPKSRLDELGLPLMSSDNTNFFQTAFTLSIEAKTGVTTGVSAQDRAHTIQVAIKDDAKSSDLARPGHVFPLAAKNGGVFERMGHTEGSVDLMQIAKLKPGAVLCELMNEDGSMTIGQDREKFARDFDIPVISVEEVLFYRVNNEKISKKTHSISSSFGKLYWHSFKFLDHTIDILERENFNSESAKIITLDDSNLKNRFLSLALLSKNDDPLISSLGLLEQEKADLVIMSSLEKTKVKAEEHEVRTKAVMCRALCELKIKNIESLNFDQNLMRIAEYFSLTVTGVSHG